MIISITDAVHICPGCEQQFVKAGVRLCAGCTEHLRLLAAEAAARVNYRVAHSLERDLARARQDLARARRNTRRAIVGLICGPGLAALGILALPYLFRAVFFLEGVLGGGR